MYQLWADLVLAIPDPGDSPPKTWSLMDILWIHTNYAPKISPQKKKTTPAIGLILEAFN